MGPTNNGAVDERTGEPLPEDKVKKGRGRELLKMESHNVKTDITWKQAKDMDLKIVKSRWDIDGWKPLPNDPHGVRVAMEINNGPRDDVFSGTPPLAGRPQNHCFLGCNQTKRSKVWKRRLLGRYGVFHAKSSGKIAV